MPIRIIGIILFSLCILTSLYASMSVNHMMTTASRERFDDQTTYEVSRLSDQFTHYANTLYVSRALFAANTDINQQKWVTFIGSLGLAQRYAGITNVGYATVVPRSNLGNFTTQLNADRAANEPYRTIFPTSTNSVSAVLTYLTPAPSRPGVIGYDLLAEPTRAKALSAARDQNSVRASTPLVLAADATASRSSPPLSILMALPVYEPYTDITTKAARQAHIQGYVLASMHIKPVLDAVLAQDNPYGPLAVSVKTAGQTIYTTSLPASSGPVGWKKTVTANVAGQTWYLAFAGPTYYGIPGRATFLPTLFLIIGILLSLLLSGFLYNHISLKLVKQHIGESTTEK